LIGKPIPVIDGHPFPMTATSGDADKPKEALRQGQQRRHGSRSSSLGSSAHAGKSWGGRQRRPN
ncbi:MAG: hypothetical protein ORN54_14145, partial [Cyclobacteriaceae bacterium]|nr:hypothetical protein [Cyclobacteriaceae bacterium]